MKKNGLLFLLILSVITPTLSQQDADKNYYSSQRTISVEVTNLAKTEAILNDFFKTHHIKILKQNTTQRLIRTAFTVEPNMLDSIDELVNGLGYITGKDYIYTDNEKAIQKLEDEIADLTNAQQKMIENKQNQIAALKLNKDKCYISLLVSEEDMVGDAVVYVNMPGFEYGVLFTDNAMNGLSAPQYQMYSLKFLFTRGKSYFSLSIFKAMNYDREDLSLYTEYFMFNFGQDFYTRHLGRGKRRYFNPYISYQVGCFLASSKELDNKFRFNVNVALGVELIKSRNFILDSKISYFMPIHKTNVNTRGIQVGIAANVLF